MSLIHYYAEWALLWISKLELESSLTGTFYLCAVSRRDGLGREPAPPPVALQGCPDAHPAAVLSEDDVAMGQLPLTLQVSTNSVWPPGLLSPHLQGHPISLIVNF